MIERVPHEFYLFVDKSSLSCNQSTSKAAEPLIEEETVGNGVAPRPGALSGISRKVGLACIFHHKKTMLPCDFLDGAHINHLPIKMDGDDGSCPLSDGLFQKSYIHEHSVFFYIDKSRDCTKCRDGVQSADIG